MDSWADKIALIVCEIIILIMGEAPLTIYDNRAENWSLLEDSGKSTEEKVSHLLETKWPDMQDDVDVICFQAHCSNGSSGI